MTERPPVAPCWVELSAENLPLAELELAACATVLDAACGAPRPLPYHPRFREVLFSRPGPEALLPGRLALARRVLRPLAEGDSDLLTDAMVLQGGSGARGRVRVAATVGGARVRALPQVLGHAYVQGGGRVDLEHPERDFLAIVGPSAAPPGSAGEPPVEGGLAEVVGEVPRSSVAARHPKLLPFRKPISLPPRLARVVVNLARVPLGGTMLDPFCGTGAILREALLLGYRATGADLDPAMVQGTLRNLAASAPDHPPEAVIASSVVELALHLPPGRRFDGIVFDPPYGRAATTGRAGPRLVLREALEALPALLRPGGRAVLLLDDPSRVDGLDGPWTLDARLEAQRVHRSLTRWIAVLRRTDRGPRQGEAQAATG